MGIQLSPEGVHGCDGVGIGDCPGISIGLGFGAALRFAVLRVVFLAALRAVAFLAFLAFFAFPFARFRATLPPPLQSG